MRNDFENITPLVNRDWIEYPNGMIIDREAGLKYYPSGVLTNLNDYIFPEVFYERKDFEQFRTQNTDFLVDKLIQSRDTDKIEEYVK